MNIFSQYGIREVADVMLYSIKRIGTEEFYLPVLYLDTLKVSTVEKPQTVTPQFGGKGNTKIISWSYDKEIKLKLEDALFSNTSLNVYMNGRVEQDMSDWTSAIAKLSVANKYGRNHYSVKAYPSPEITDDEWEIIYRCAQKAGFDPRTGAMDNDAYQIGYNRLDDYDNHTMKYVYDNDSYNKDINVMVAENRWLLKTNYYHRTQKTPRNRDISPFFDIITLLRFGKAGILRSCDSINSNSIPTLVMHGGNDMQVTIKNSPVGKKHKIQDNPNARTVLYESKYHNVYLAKDAEQYLNDTFAKIESLGKNSPEAYEVYQNIDYALITKEDLSVMETVSSFLEECVMKRDFLTD